MKYGWKYDWKFLLLGVSLTSLFWGAAFAAEDDRPYLPSFQVNAAGVMEGGLTAYNSSFLDDSVLAPAVHFTENQPSYALNSLKGALGESLMDGVFTNTLLKQTGGWAKLTPARVGSGGIDGLYVRMDPLGNPRRLLVADAKTYSARLGKTQDGKQMSDSWIRPRIQQTANNYRGLAEKLQNEKVTAYKNPPKVPVSKQILVQINDKTYALVWNTKNGLAYYSPNKNVTSEQLCRQARRTSIYLQGAADGKITYRSELFTYKTENGMHVISSKTLDADAKVVSERILARGTFEDLPENYRKVIRRTAIRTLNEQKGTLGIHSIDDLKTLVRDCCNNPEKFKKLCVQPRITPSLIRAGVTTGTALVLIGGVDAISQYVTTGTVDLVRTGKITLLTGSSTVLGVAASFGLQSFGVGMSAANAVGGSIAACGLAYGMYFMGYCTLGEANWMAAAGTAVLGIYAATPVVLTAVAYYFGTASTGAAISSLSGIAATNAALAWLGGGTIAAGGAGVAGGTAVLTAATCGAALVVVAIPIAWQTWKYCSSLESQNVYLSELVRYTHERVQNGKQLEWNTLAL